MTDDYATFIHTTSLALLFLAPVLIALPPRKLDLYTVALGGAFVLSANQLTKERTGLGIMGNIASMAGDRKMSKAEEFHLKYKLEKERRLRENPSVELRPASKLETAAKELWMGGEKEGWKERRLKEEQEKIEQGEGYGGMIMDQIWEVWNWGQKKAEELKAADRDAISAEELQKMRSDDFTAKGSTKK